MSEQGAPQPSNPAAGMVEAFFNGDRQTAQKALDARNAASGIGGPEGQNNAPASLIEVPAADTRDR